MNLCTPMVVLANAPSPPEDSTYTKTKGLPNKIFLKVGVPILITVYDFKYKEDGVSMEHVLTLIHSS